MIISLTASGAPLVDQIQDQILGLITTGLLPASQRRVSANTSATPRDVLAAATQLATASKREGVDLDQAVRVLRAVWSD